MYYCRFCGTQRADGELCSCPNAVNQQPQVVRQVNTAPVAQLKTNRGLFKFIVLSIITFGIYPLVFFYCLVEDINTIASRYDGKKTMNYLLMMWIVAPLTLGIGAIVWEHRMCNRMARELYRRRIPYSFSAADFWLWGVLGSLILVGPAIYLYKTCKTMNLLAAHYNLNG